MRRVNAIVLALVIAAAIGLLATFVILSRNGNTDKLRDEQLSQGTQTDETEKLCSSGATYTLIKRELFRRAAELRGNDQAAVSQLAGYAVLRMDNPVLEGEDKQINQVRCSGSVSLDLPPGVAAAGNRRTLTGDIDYAIQPSADGTKAVVTLGNADAMIALLATVARVQAPPPAPSETNVVGNETDELAPIPSVPTTPAPTGPGRSNPSFDCVNAHSPGELAVCADSGLGALDRNMATQYRRALAAATPEQKVLLRNTAARFYLYRDHCTDRTCIGEAYVERMREIRDIMEGTWSRPR